MDPRQALTPDNARLIATIAHAAAGNKRANGNPYIVHPRRVALLTAWFIHRYWQEITEGAFEDGSFERFNWPDDCYVAAWLHDVLEDTRLDADDLIGLGLTYQQSDILWRLTKEDDQKPEGPEYFQAISECMPAMVVKCADICANLEDAYRDLFLPVERLTPRRWANYVAGKRELALPLYAPFKGLQSELLWRFGKIEKALPMALERRQQYVERQRILKLVKS